MPRTPKPKNDFTRGPAENTGCPAFIALSFDELVECDDDLNELVRVLAGLVDPNDPDGEDVAIWSGNTIAAVVQSDGTVTRFDRGPPRPQKG